MFSILLEAHIDQVHYSITHCSVSIVEKVLFFKPIDAHIDQRHYNIIHYSVRNVEKVLFSKLIEDHIDQVHYEITISHTTV